MEVYKIGTGIRLGPDEDIVGRINEILIRPDGILYRCSWWKDSVRREEYFHKSELVLKTYEKLQIGFK